jgi:6-phosphogluconolactonase
MAAMTTYRLQVTSGADDLARHAAEQVALAIDLALAERDRAQIALAGGTTPRQAYTLLAQEHLPWERVDVLLGDERWVSPEDPASNARLVHESLLARGPGHQACFHAVPTHLPTPDQGAESYGALLVQLCGGEPPSLDVVLLGLGEDGHTASLFPGTPAPLVRDRWVTTGQGKGLPRITLTAPALSAARKVIFLVSGAGKRQALSRLLDGQEPAERTPARLVRPRGEVLILADAEAGAGLPEHVIA